MTQADGAPWGRVDDGGTVYVRTADGERAVGEYPDATPEEALAYFERKFTELEGTVTLLEQRAKRGAPATDVAKAVAKMRETLVDAAAVGDYAALERRLDALGGTVETLTEQQTAESKAAVEQAVAERTAIVVEAEALAAQDPGSVQWKQATAQLDDLFARWQRHQHDSPRLPKAEGNELWKRFRTARSTVEQHRRAFFAELDSAHKDAKHRKEALVERAEALAPRGADGISAYRSLLDEWKRSGRAGKKADDALWARFKAAGDALFQAKAEVDAATDAEYGENLTAKLELIEQAQPILAETDRRKARTALSAIQDKWDAIGRVPRNDVRRVEDGLRKVEAHVKSLDDAHWEKSNPERNARAEGMTAQLTDAIAKLEAELAAATKQGDAKAIAQAQEALDARKAWLKALGV